MKHTLNDLSSEERNSILEQHQGGIKVKTENFSKLVNNKLGNSKPFLPEQEEKLSLCNPDELEKILSVLGSARNFTITLSEKNPNLVLVKDAEGKGSCHVKRKDIFKI